MIPIVYPQNRTSPASTDYLISEYENVLVMLAHHYWSDDDGKSTLQIH